jgi:hypothetical protein
MSEKKYFYEKCDYFNEPHINLKYEDVLKMTLKEFEDWVAMFRKTVVEVWNETGAPPRIGSSEVEIIEQFSKLQTYKVDKFEEKDDDGDEVIFNFNKFATPVNQFFPAMYKTGIGGSTYDKPKPSIYDIFCNDEYLAEFAKQMRRLTRQDAMYRFSKTLAKGNKEHHNSHLPTAKEWIEKWHISSLKTSNWGEDIDSLVDLEKQPIQLKWYPLGQTIFPEATAAFRIGMGTQAAVNFPPLTAKYLYQRFTNHIKEQKQINIYDPSSGWGGRILGALSVDDRNLHYIGNDPNTENYIAEIGKTRYEYLAEFFNSRIPGAANPFWGHKNTYEIYRTGSEIISEEPGFQKWKGQLDFIFTSPPYFDRERYSDDETQSFKKFSNYESWRDGFLRPTLTTAYEWLRNDRYILWNIADIKIGKSFYPLEQDSIDILTELGMEYQGKIKMTMSPMTGVDLSNVKNSMKINGEFYKYEPIFIFYKK